MAIEDAYELAYREAVRALEHQRATLAELRNRASVLLAAASIATSLLGGSPNGARAAAWLAAACFAMLSACVLVVVWPHGDGSFDADPQALLATHLATGAPDAIALSSDLIAHIATHGRTNGRRLARMTKAFRIGACLLAIQMVLTLVAVTAIV